MRNFIDFDYPIDGESPIPLRVWGDVEDKQDTELVADSVSIRFDDSKTTSSVDITSLLTGKDDSVYVDICNKAEERFFDIMTNKDKE